MVEIQEALQMYSKGRESQYKHCALRVEMEGSFKMSLHSKIS